MFTCVIPIIIMARDWTMSPNRPHLIDQNGQNDENRAAYQRAKSSHWQNVNQKCWSIGMRKQKWSPKWSHSEWIGLDHIGLPCLPPNHAICDCMWWVTLTSCSFVIIIWVKEGYSIDEIVTNNEMVPTWTLGMHHCQHVWEVLFNFSPSESSDTSQQRGLSVKWGHSNSSMMG